MNHEQNSESKDGRPDQARAAPKEKPLGDSRPPRPLTAEEKARRRRIVRIAIIVAIVLAVLLLVLFLVRNFENSKKANLPPPKITITEVTAQKGNIGVYLDAIGTVVPVYTAMLSSQVAGVVTQVHFKEGQLVRKGDPLIDIDVRPYAANLLQAQGTLERDENLLGQARMDLARYREAWARNAIAKQILDDQEKLVLQDEGVVKSDRGTVQYDQVQVDFCHITAPFPGRVGLRLVDPGNFVTTAGTTTLAVLTQESPITVVFTIPEDNLGEVQARLRSGAKLAAYAFDRTGQKQLAEGELLTLNNQVDTTTGTVKARAQFGNQNGALFPNQFVNTRLLLNTLQNVTLIPASTIQQNGSKSYVYVIQDNVAHIRDVTPGVTNIGFTQVQGVNPGEVLASSSFDKLKDNTQVQLAPPPGTQQNGKGDGKSGKDTTPSTSGKKEQKPAAGQGSKS